MSKQMSSLDAILRAQLAQERLENWLDVARRAEDRADSRRSKSWRSRDLAEAERAYRLADKAASDVERWTALAESLIEAEEREERRRRSPRKTPAKKGAKKKAAPAKRKRVKKKAPEPEPPRRLKRYEYILKVSYEAGRRKGDRAKNHHVWWDVRFRKLDGSRATEAELEYAVRRIHVGEVPRGWDVLSIAWDRGKRESDDDTPSREAGSQSELIAAMGALGATLDSRGGMSWHDHRNEYVGGNYTVGEEEVE